jgi:DNA transposition AAA+ family ATPase
MLKLKPLFVKTRNVRNFEVLIDGLDIQDEGCFALIHGKPGLGKTRTSIWYQANNGGIYLRMAKVWETSPLDFLQALCLELGITKPPARKGTAYKAIIDILIRNPRKVFVDEVEKLPTSRFLEICRDITDVTGSPFIMIGEDELVTAMKMNMRVWSRTYQKLEFKGVEASDVLAYAHQAAGLKLSPDAGVFLCNTSDGDFRLIRRELIKLMQYADAKDVTDINTEDVKIAVKTGLRGR